MIPGGFWAASATEPAKAGATGGKKVAQDIFAGTCGGIAVTLVGHPFDTTKVRLQTQSSTNPIYSGPVDVVRKTLQWEGPAGLYKGVASPLAGQMFFRATLFGAFGAAKRWLSKNPDGTTRPLTTLDYYTAGAITGFVSAFVEGPIDFFKSQIQVQIIRAKANPDYKPAFTGVLGSVKTAFQVNGLKGPFQGLGATIVRNAPANSIYLGSFEVLKEQFAKMKGCSVRDLPAWATVTAAGTGGLMYWLVIYPVDQVKSAIMCDSLNPSERVYPNMSTAFRKLYAEGGIPRFYKGFTPCLLRAFPANGIMLLTVDSVNNMLDK